MSNAKPRSDLPRDAEVDNPTSQQEAQITANNSKTQQNATITKLTFPPQPQSPPPTGAPCRYHVSRLPPRHRHAGPPLLDPRPPATPTPHLVLHHGRHALGPQPAGRDPESVPVRTGKGRGPSGQQAPQTRGAAGGGAEDARGAGEDGADRGTAQGMNSARMPLFLLRSPRCFGGKYMHGGGRGVD